MIRKSTIKINSILFSFGIPMPMNTTLSDAHSIDMKHSLTWLICKSSPDMIGYCGATVWLCTLHIIYEIAHHYSSVFVTMYTYVH